MKTHTTILFGVWLFTCYALIKTLNRNDELSSKNIYLEQQINIRDKINERNKCINDSLIRAGRTYKVSPY